MIFTNQNILELSLRKSTRSEAYTFESDLIKSQIYYAPNFSIFVGDFYFNEDTILKVEKDKSEVVLFFNLNGNRTVHYNDIPTEKPLQSGQHNLLYSYDNKNQLYLKKRIRQQSLVLFFNPAYFIDLVQESCIPFDGTFLNSIQKEQPKIGLKNHMHLTPKMNTILLDLVSELQKDKNPLHIKALVYQLLYLQLEQMGLQKSDATSIPSKDKVKLEHVRTLLIDELNYGITIKELAKTVGLNTTKLKSLFSSAYGKPLKAYQLEIRMHEAKQRLLNESFSIAEIAYMAGYAYPEHFTRSFKKYFGYPPITIRKRPNVIS
tara:strand:+ start:370 stop:1326 length:957 start_codon:yes stop_codon:yes gene_type:complete